MVWLGVGSDDVLVGWWVWFHGGGLLGWRGQGLGLRLGWGGVQGWSSKVQ